MTTMIRSRAWPLPVLVAGLAMALVMIAGLSVNRLVGVGSDSCRMLAEGEIIESEVFFPYEQRLSHLPVEPLTPSTAGTGEIPVDSLIRDNTLDGLPLRHAIVGPDGILIRYFWDRPVAPHDTVLDIWAGGGIELDRGPSNFGTGLARELAAQLGVRAVLVDLGQYEGALTWADPEANGVRAHHLSWSDGTYNYTLIADRSAVETVNLARSMVCG